MPSKNRKPTFLRENDKTPRRGAEIRPEPVGGGVDSFDDSSSGEPKRTAKGFRAHGDISITDQKFGESSGPAEFDGRARLREPNEADENGKWNKVKSRPAVVISRDNIRKP